MSLEEQLRNDAQSLREVGWFNRAIMMDAAANEIQKLNERIKRLEEALYESAALNINWAEDASDEDLNYYTEYRGVIKQAKEALKLSKNPNINSI